MQHWLHACAALCALAASSCATQVDPSATGDDDDETTSNGTGGGGGTETTGPGSGGVTTSSTTSSATGAGGAASSASASSSSTASSSSAASSGAGGSGGGPVVIVDCTNCTPSPAGSCASDVVVVGHYGGGPKSVCIEKGDLSAIKLVLMSYETTDWALGGEVARVSQIQVYSYDPAGTVSGNANIPTAVQQGGAFPADPYDYAMSMGDCPAHTGYAGAVFGVPQADVCHMENGLPDACSSPAYTCLAIDP